MYFKIATVLLTVFVLSGCSNSYNGRVFKKYKKTESDRTILISDRKNSKYFRKDIAFGFHEEQALLLVRENKNIKIEELAEEYKKKKEEEAKEAAENISSSAIEAESSTESAVKAEEKDSESDEDVFKKKSKKAEPKELYTIYFCIKHYGKNWVYMNSLTLRDKSGKESIDIDFGTAASKDIIKSDGVTILGGIYESSCFTIDKIKAEKLYKFLKGKENIEMIVRSEYDNRVFKRDMRNKEIEQIVGSYEIYIELEKEVKEKIEQKLIEMEKEKEKELEKQKEQSGKKEEDTKIKS